MTHFCRTRLLALMFGCTLGVSFSAVPLHAQEKTAKDTGPNYEMLELFGDVFERVRENYVEEVEDKDLIESAINGMLTSLDPHSSYLPADAFEEMQVQTKGEFGGLGIEVTMENGLIKVVSPIDETPAAEAGIKAGDYISHLNDEAVMGLSLSEAVDKMRGKVGTSIELTVLREGEEKPLKFTLKRDIIKIRSVRSRIEEGIAYLRVTSFSEQTHSGMVKAFERLKKESGKNGIQGVILDLRNNPGGLLDQAIKLADAFLTEGEIVSTRGRAEDTAKRYNAQAGDITDGLPIVVLINGGSASASEIVAGALQDHKRAMLLGTKSFGKGSVQSVIPLSENGAMRLTTARYYTPSGRSIQAEGIVPDIEVIPSKIEAIEMANRSEADLPGHLANTAGLKLELTDKERAARAKRSKEALEDYQLQRALDLIHGIRLYRAQNSETAPPAAAKATPSS